MKLDGILFCLFMNKLVSMIMMLIWMEFEETELFKMFLEWRKEKYEER